MYRTIDTSIWNDPRIRKLDCTSKLLALYLITNDRTHVTGLYFFSLALASDELDIDIAKTRKAFKSLCAVNFLQWDEERRVVWVVNMWKRQPHVGVHLDRLEKYFLSLNGTPLVAMFLQKYPHPAIPVTNSALLCHEKEPTGHESALSEQEQEQDKNKSTPSATPKKDQVVELKSQLPDYQTKYLNLDVGKEYEKWQDWMAAKGKTFKNYQAAFRNWLRNAEEFKKGKNSEEAEAQTKEPEHPLWLEIKTLRSYDFQVLRQEALPYARQKSQCGDKREPPEEVTRAYMIKIYEAEKARAP